MVAGYTAEKQFQDTKYVIARNFPDDQVTTINGGEVTGGSQSQEEWSLVSMLGRVNYSFMDRYLATLTFRSDRSSRFGWGNQTGYFPSLSVGWQILEESFMQGVDLFSQLKVIGWSRQAPALPYVTSRPTSDDRVRRQREALYEAAADPQLEAARATLLLTGFSILPEGAYEEMLAMEREAQDLGYGELR